MFTTPKIHRKNILHCRADRGVKVRLGTIVEFFCSLHSLKIPLRDGPQRIFVVRRRYRGCKMLSRGWLSTVARWVSVSVEVAYFVYNTTQSNIWSILKPTENAEALSHTPDRFSRRLTWHIILKDGDAGPRVLVGLKDGLARPVVPVDRLLQHRHSERVRHLQKKEPLHLWKRHAKRKPNFHR